MKHSVFFIKAMNLHQKKTKVKLSRLKRLGVLLCMLPALASAQEEIIVFHNCENLFYPTKDSLHADDDFTYEGKKHWTFKKYQTKLNQLAKTYISIDAKQMPSLIALAEIENDKVLEALTKGTSLRKVGYKYIHYPSHDIRGIDVALLYDTNKFTIIESRPLTPVSQREEDRTRDVLYVFGVLNTMPIHIFVVHAPSRRENNIKKDLRKKIFEDVYSHIKTLQAKGEKNFLVMGDMNDNPWDETIEQGFHTERDLKSEISPLLYNLMQDNKDKTGSYFFNGNVLSFDQFLVSESIKERIVFSPNCNNTFIYKPSFLVKQSKRTKYDVPFSTYKGMKYEGGISDHFPIVLRLKTN